MLELRMDEHEEKMSIAGSAYIAEGMWRTAGPLLLQAGRFGILLIQEYYVDEENWVENAALKFPGGEC